MQLSLVSMTKNLVQWWQDSSRLQAYQQGIKAGAQRVARQHKPLWNVTRSDALAVLLKCTHDAASTVIMDFTAPG